MGSFVKNRPVSLGPQPHVLSPIAHEANEIDHSPEARAGMVTEALRATTADVRHLINRLRNSIPVYADELYVSNTTDTVLTGKAYSTNLIRITAIIVTTPIASTSVVLQLGARPALPLSAGTVVLAPISFVLAPQDKRVLTVAPAAQSWMWFMGEQLPEVDL
jgi:hypothetical protein